MIGLSDHDFYVLQSAPREEGRVDLKTLSLTWLRAVVPRLEV